MKGKMSTTTVEGKIVLTRSETEDAEVIIPAGIEVIGENVFAENKNLVSVKLPYSLKEIGRYAFSNCYNLKSVEILTGVVEIDEFAFWGCKCEFR